MPIERDDHKLVRQAVRYLAAARQDEHPVIAALHYAYAVAWFEAARKITRDGGLARGIDQALSEAQSEQDQTQRELLRRFPPRRPLPAVVLRTGPTP